LTTEEPYPDKKIQGKVLQWPLLFIQRIDTQEGKYMTQATDEKLPFYRNWHELIKPEKLEVDKSKHTETYGKFIC
jgi:hypothetical protein